MANRRRIARLKGALSWTMAGTALAYLLVIAAFGAIAR